MTSFLKVAANRRNAKLSTVPNSVGGRVRSAQNARRHGLTQPISSDDALSEEARSLARNLVAALKGPELQGYVERAAETQVDLNRIRRLKQHMLRTALEVSENRSHASKLQHPSYLAEVIQDLHRLERYERRAWSRRKAAFRELQFTHQGMMTIDQS